jgi:hypothetical protein
LKLTASNGGVVMVNFMSGYVVPTEKLKSEPKCRGDYKTVVDHIEHIIRVAGIDHVGIGSDFDGVFDLPVGLDDVSYYPMITQELLNRGYDRDQIHKILGGNVLRVMEQAENVAARMKLERRSVSTAAAPLFKLTIPPENRERTNCVVKSAIDPGSYEKNHVTLADAQGNLYVGQLSAGPRTTPNSKPGSNQRELTFILPMIEAHQPLKLVATDALLGSHREFVWHDDRSTSADLMIGDLPVMKYMYEAVDDSTPARREETFKVYHHVYSPNGRFLVTKGPGGLYPHHRGLFYGFNRIRYGDNTADIWHCRNGETQTHEQILSQTTGPVFGQHVVAIDWRGTDGKPFARELREMTAYKIAGATLIEFDSVLQSTGGSVRLDGDPQHAGFQFRASQVVADKTNSKTYFIRPDGAGKPGEFRNWSGDNNDTDVNRNHMNLPWNAACFVLPQPDDRQGNPQPDALFTCCYLDHPDNPKPARYSERDYGRFGSYFEFELTPQTPLHVRYRIWLQEGEMTVDEIQALSDDFVRPVIATVE